MKAIDPALAQALQPNLDDMLEWVLYNDATATAEAVSGACWATAGAECTATPTPSTAATLISSTTPQPLPLVSLPTPMVMQPVTKPSTGQSLIIAASLIGLVILGYLLVKKVRAG